MTAVEVQWCTVKGMSATTVHPSAGHGYMTALVFTQLRLIRDTTEGLSHNLSFCYR
jgi:hypothetical protein